MNIPVQDTIANLISLPGVQEALVLLRSKLPPNLTYHAYKHTEDVLKEVIRLTVADNLPPRDQEIVSIAAAWHDVGFIYAMQNNEPLAAAAVRQSAALCAAYSPEEIALIERMILDTALVPYNESFRQVPSTPLSRYLLDADLANFGRDDFFEKSELQRLELGDDAASFRRKTLLLIENHVWLTPAAEKLWADTKARNVEKLREQIAQDSHR
jgi:predicted metal-dependent HD superfamily phosphohydrolase